MSHVVNTCLFVFLFVVMVQVATQRSNLETWQRVVYLLATAAAFVGWVFNWINALSTMTGPALDDISLGSGVLIVVYGGYCILNRPSLTTFQKRMYGIVILGGLLMIVAHAGRLWSLHQ